MATTNGNGIDIAERRTPNEPNQFVNRFSGAASIHSTSTHSFLFSTVGWKHTKCEKEMTERGREGETARRMKKREKFQYQFHSFFYSSSNDIIPVHRSSGTITTYSSSQCAINMGEIVRDLHTPAPDPHSNSLIVICRNDLFFDLCVRVVASHPVNASCAEAGIGRPFGMVRQMQ